MYRLRAICSHMYAGPKQYSMVSMQNIYRAHYAMPLMCYML